MIRTSGSSGSRTSDNKAPLQSQRLKRPFDSVLMLSQYDYDRSTNTTLGRLLGSIRPHENAFSSNRLHKDDPGRRIAGTTAIKSPDTGAAGRAPQQAAPRCRS